MTVILAPAAAAPAPREAARPFVLTYIVCYGKHLEALEDGTPAEGVVSLGDLRELGVDNYTLVWLIYQGHIEHFCGGPDTPADQLQFHGASRFSLTATGAAFASVFVWRALLADDEEEFDDVCGWIQIGSLLPRYDAQARQFTWGRQLLKWFRQPAVNQETVLASAEELGWPVWFDDPLPRKLGVNPKVRLHDTIKDLNRRQGRLYVHFKGDGSGRRIGWELC